MDRFEPNRDRTTERWGYCTYGVLVALSILQDAPAVWFVIAVFIALNHLRHQRCKVCFALIIIGFIIGVVRTELSDQSNPSEEEHAVEDAWVVSSTRLGAGAKVIMWHPSIEGYSILNQERCIELPEEGSRIISRGQVSPLRTAPHPGAYDALQNGLRANIKWRFSGQIDCSNQSRSVRTSLRVRRRVRQLMMDGEPHYGHRLLTGILLGDRFNLPKDALDAFGESGTGHLLAVSGLHIGAAALSTFWILNLLALRMRLRFPHRIGILGALVAVATMLTVSNAPRVHSVLL